MPSFGFTPAAIVLTGGDFFPEPIRFSFTPAALAFTGGDFTLGSDYSQVSSSLNAIRLNRLRYNLPVVNKDGTPSKLFQQDWQRSMEQIEEAVTALNTQVTDLSSLVAQLQQAQATAQQAVTTANAVSARIDLANSYTEPNSVVTASSDGTVTIAAHTRVYDNGTSVSVNGGSLTGFSEGQFVRVYYTDSAREGGTVAFQGTTDDVVQSGDIHVVGGVAIPALGQAPSEGLGSFPPGYVPNLNVALF